MSISPIRQGGTKVKKRGGAKVKKGGGGGKVKKRGGANLHKNPKIHTLIRFLQRQIQPLFPEG